LSFTDHQSVSLQNNIIVLCILILASAEKGRNGSLISSFTVFCWRQWNFVSLLMFARKTTRKHKYRLAVLFFLCYNKKKSGQKYEICAEGSCFTCEQIRREEDNEKCGRRIQHAQTFDCRQPYAVAVSPVRKTNEVNLAVSTLQRHTGWLDVLFRPFLILTLEEGGFNVTPRPP